MASPGKSDSRRMGVDLELGADPLNTSPQSSRAVGLIEVADVGAIVTECRGLSPSLSSEVR